MSEPKVTFRIRIKLGSDHYTHITYEHAQILLTALNRAALESEPVASVAARVQPAIRIELSQAVGIKIHLLTFSRALELRRDLKRVLDTYKKEAKELSE